MSSKPSAFVIMPFDEELKPVFTHFIKPVLEEEGFDVERADDIESQQNILKDILDQIRNSDLIIADLTDLNANVFYELGLAHAFRKPVLLFTQAIGEVPFDLKSYRLLEYSDHFVKIEGAKKELQRYAKGFLEGTIEFGSPVIDFVPSDEMPALASTTNEGSAQSESLANVSDLRTEGEDAGFLDHQIAMTDGYERITDILAGATTDMQTLTRHVENATNEANSISSNPNASSARATRNVFRRLAGNVNSFNASMKKTNSEYESVLKETEDSLEYIVAFLLQNPDIPESEWDDFYNQLEGVENNGIFAQTACLYFATTMDSVPRIESRLSRAVTLGSEELRVLAGNIERTIASVARAKQRIDGRGIN